LEGEFRAQCCSRLQMRAESQEVTKAKIKGTKSDVKTVKYVDLAGLVLGGEKVGNGANGRRIEAWERFENG